MPSAMPFILHHASKVLDQEATALNTYCNFDIRKEQRKDPVLQSWFPTSWTNVDQEKQMLLRRLYISSCTITSTNWNLKRKYCTKRQIQMVFLRNNWSYWSHASLQYLPCYIMRWDIREETKSYHLWQIDFSHFWDRNIPIFSRARFSCLNPRVR